MELLAFLYALFMLLFGRLFVVDGGHDGYYRDSFVSDRCSLDLSGGERPEVPLVQLSGADNCSVSDLYGRNWLHTEVVGLFGSPVEVAADEFDGAVLTFTYDPDKLHNIPPENLLVLWYYESASVYIEMQPQLHEPSNTVSLDIAKGGAYMLVDRYEWFSAWGADVEDYAHDTYFTGDGFTPGFGIEVPKSIKLSQFASDTFEAEGMLSYRQLGGAEYDSDPYFTARYYYGDDAWQRECDTMAETIYAPRDYTQMTELPYTLKGGAQAKLYRFEYDETSRGGGSGISLILHVKISNDEFLSFSYGISDVADSVTEATCLEYLNTFGWTGELPEEAYVPAKEWDPAQHPEVGQETEVKLQEYVYTAAEPHFTMLLPDCVDPHDMGKSTDLDWGDYIQRGLMICNGSDDIYYDINYYSSDDMWERRLDAESYIFSLEGESHTVEDISGYTGFDSEVYVLRFADTGKVESNHLSMYVYGFYKLSDTEMVEVRCDLWADAEDEYMELIMESMRSFRFTE